jgi:hypothetical protein
MHNNAITPPRWLLEEEYSVSIIKQIDFHYSVAPQVLPERPHTTKSDKTTNNTTTTTTPTKQKQLHKQHTATAEDEHKMNSVSFFAHTPPKKNAFILFHRSSLHQPVVSKK